MPESVVDATTPALWRSALPTLQGASGKVRAMSSAAPTTGQDVDSMCNKCGGERRHVIVAMVEDKIAKVICKECNAEHRYKAPKGTHVTKAAPKKRKTTTRKKKDDTPEVKIVEADLSKPPRPYKASESFEPGERVDHVKFGQGIVQGTAGAGKMRVLFETEIKLLATSGGPKLTLERPAPFQHKVNESNDSGQQ